MTETVLLLESSKDHYTAEACILWCFDDRFWKLRKNFIKQRGFDHIDLVESAGGAKALAEDTSVDKDFILNQVGLSIKLHGTALAILVVHIDCGAYGGSASFGNDRDAEYAHHAEELSRAEVSLKTSFPDLQVERYIADFDGLHRIH